MKIICLDLDGPLIPDRCKYFDDEKYQHDFYLDVNHWVTFDPFAVRFLNRLVDMNDDLHFVLHSTWRKHYDKKFLDTHFSIQGLHVRWHQDWFTDPQLSRWDSIDLWLKKHPSVTNEMYAILDDEKPPLNFKTRTVRVNEYDGLSEKNCARLISLLQLQWKVKTPVFNESKPS